MALTAERHEPPAAKLERNPFAATLALAVTLAVAGWAVAMSLVLMAIRPTPLPAPLPPQNQDAETLAFLLAFGVALPLGLVAAPRLVRAILAGGSGRALLAFAGLLAASFAAAVVVLRLAGALGVGDGVRAVLVAAAAWWLLAGAALARATRPRPWPALLRVARLAGPIWAVAAILVLATLASITDLGAGGRLGVALGAPAAAAVAAAAGLRRHPQGLTGRWGAAVDIVVVGLVLLAVPDLVVFRAEQAGAGDPVSAFETGVIQFHHNFLLGPANEVLAGRGMLADTASQYGVGSIYLLVGWFLLAPIGYGTLAFLTGALTALWFAAGYGVLRMAGTSRLLAGPALALAVVALVFNLSYPVGALPQSGPLRFGLPMAVIVAAVAGERWPGHARAARAAALAAVGLSAIWSLEALVYTATVFAAIAGLQAWLQPTPGRLRWLARQILLATLAGACAHVLFATATLAGTGRLPDWGRYLAYLDAFLFGQLGELTYDVPRWTPGLAVGAGYLASAAAAVELARRRAAVMQRERPALTALTGMTAYGIALMSYYVDRSLDHILIYVGLPAVLVCVLWLGLLLRSNDGASRAARAGGLAFSLCLGVIALAAAWPAIGDRFGRSALAHLAPGGTSVRGAIDRLWHPPPLYATAPAGERALARHIPGDRESLVMVQPDLATEILIRSDRFDRLRLGDPWEASFVAAQHLPELRGVLADLRPGDRMLMDEPARETLEALRAKPAADPLRLSPPRLAPLQQWALEGIDDRFELRPVAPERDGFTVVELTLKA